MPLEPFLLQLLEDPTDRGQLIYIASESVLFNPRKKIAYEVRDAIPVLLPQEAREATEEEAQRWQSDASGVTTGAN